jgi:pyrroloquinoline-quinone synthase
MVRDVHELDQERPPRADPIDAPRFAADPVDGGGERRDRDVFSFRSQGAGIVPPFALNDEEEALAAATWDRIENARERWNVLRHPFYRRWSAGELDREELARYSGQYRHAVQAIATLAEDVATASGGELDDHAREERDHVALWDGFVDAADGRADAGPTPQTRACVREWTSAEGTLGKLVTLFAIESGQPEISRIKRAGLVERYGFVDGPGTAYFEVHERRDADHAAEARELIETLADDADGDGLVANAEAAFRANWRLLDGV